MSWIPRLLGRNRLSPRRRPPPALAIERLESRHVPSSAFGNGVLIVQADAPASDDVVHVRSAGAARDGSTGVWVESNLVNAGVPTRIGDAAHPVVRITLDLKDGNDTVSIAGLAKTGVRVGEGNGNNVIRIGAAEVVGVVAGQGQNHLILGGGSDGATLKGLAPGNVLTPAGTVVFIGRSYSVDAATGGVFAPAVVGNNRDNRVVIDDRAGQAAVVDIYGGGRNVVHTGDGNDVVWIQGDGNNRINVEGGTNQIEVDGNGNNRIRAEGTGSITVNGQGNNRIDAGNNPADRVVLTFAGTGGRNRVRVATGAAVTVNGALATASGRLAGTHTFVHFKSAHGHGCDDR